MKKAISVRKSRVLRYWSRCLNVAILAAMIGTFVWTRELLLAALILIPMGIGLGVALFCETWEMIFDQERIRFRVLFREWGAWSWYEISDAFRGWYTSENHFLITLCFSDGRKLRLRMNDEHADQALKEICRHCSLRDL